MAAEAVAEWSGHPVLAGLELVRDGVDLAANGHPWSLGDGELADAVVDLTALIARAQALRAALLREHVARQAPDTRGRQGARTVALLRERCRVSAVRARADVADAQVTCPETGDLRGLGAAWAAGEVSADHVGVGRRTLSRLPRQVVRERRDEVDAVLTDHATHWDPGTTDALARRLLAAVCPERADRYDEHAHERRHLGVCTDSTGMVLLRGQIDPAGGLTVATVLDHVVGSDRASGAAAEQEQDVRTRGQRRADALVRIATLAAESLGLAAPGAKQAQPAGKQPAGKRAARSVPRVVVVTTPEQLAGARGAGPATTTAGDLVDPGTLTRLACDAVIDRVVLAPDGRVLSTDTLGRLATPAQQNALAARDRGCTWPGCSTPPALCEAHHAVWWSRGGPTTIDNLTLLCHRHHTAIHAQPDHGLQVVMREGLPWYRPPTLGGTPPPLRRNTFHQCADDARRTGTRWGTSTDP